MKTVFKKFFMLSAISMLLFAACSSDGGHVSKGPEDKESVVESGTVSIEVSVDGKYYCPYCETGYDTEAEALACGKTEECPAYEYTVTFTNSDENASEENKSSEIKVVKGNTISEDAIPAWTNSDTSNTYDLEWTSDVDGYTISSKIKADVEFTSNWRKYYTVTFKDSEVTDADTNADVTQKVYDDASSKTVTAPSWEKTGYTLSWTPAFDSTAEVSADATYTAVWTARAKYTVTYKDVSAYDEDTVNEDSTEEVYEGDKPASVPSWTKTHYTLSWTKDGETVTPSETEITADTTFTASWTEDAKYTVTFVDSEISSDVTEGEAIAAETDSELDTQTVYEGEYAELPGWASSSRTNKADYTVTWTSSVDGLTPSTAITADVTFTASWAKTPAETVITFNKDGSATDTTVVSGASSKSYKTEQTYTTAAGTEISTSYGAKLNSKGSITLTLADSYTVLLVQGTDKTYTKGLTINDSDGTSYTGTLSENVVTVSLSAGTYTITNGGSETSVFAIVLQK